MKTIVLIKQVPVVSAMKLDPETKTLKREGVPSEVSSFDIRREIGSGLSFCIRVLLPQSSPFLALCYYKT
jgi:hypothetical protein